MTRHLTTLVLAALLAPAAFAETDLDLRFWSVDLGGVVLIDGPGGGTPINLVTELGLAGSEDPDLRLVWRPGPRTSVRLGWAEVGFDGGRVLTETVRVGGQEFTLSTLVSSVFELELAHAGFAWQFLATPDSSFRLGPLVEIQGIRGDVAIAAPQLPGSPSAADRFEVAFGAAGLALDWELGERVHLSAESTVQVGLDEGDLTDTEVVLRFFPTEILALVAGFRTVEVEPREGNDLFNLEIEGPFFGGVLRF